ncbi:MAG: hypothetical protein LCH91_09850 [Bacteroidetes bacterium]|nr:hypothetical protein [Bacteroidota bacterium]
MPLYDSPLNHLLNQVPPKRHGDDRRSVKDVTPMGLLDGLYLLFFY